MSVLIGLAVLAVPVAVVVWLVRGRRRDADVAGGGSSTRRGLVHLLLVVAQLAAAAGVTRLLTAALPSGSRIVGPGAEEIALGLALVIVTLPAWLALWLPTRRRLAEDAAERASTAWALHAAVAATTALVVTVVQAIAVGSWWAGVGGSEWPALATFIVWGGVCAGWAWFLARSGLAPSGPLGGLVSLAGSAVGLVTLAIGAVGIVAFGLGQLLHAVAGPALVEGASTAAVRRGLVTAAVGASVWWWYWLRQGLTSPRDRLWDGYVVLAGAAGLVTAVVSAIIALDTALSWVAGTSAVARAAVHFATTPRAIAACLVGALFWRYHAAVLHHAGTTRGEADRAWDYVTAAVGLVTSVVGGTLAVVAIIEAAMPAPLAGPSAGDTVTLALVTLAVGAPLRTPVWRGLQARVHAGDIDELQSTARRVYVQGVLGLSGVVTAGSVVSILFVVFRDLLEGRLGAASVRDVRVGIGLAVAAGATAAYHWAVQRADRAATPPRPPRRQVLLVSPDGAEAAAALAERTGASVRSLHRLDVDVDAGAVDADAIADAVAASTHTHLLVTVDADGTVHAIPIERE
jgi:hypothetical protein